ncbi:MAG: hypothetical protein SWE60_26720 [Thermodesulfobacteriota bacterium]|nr:hypothetical protein [Thermodesulfobacteriota bacterium]
MERATSLWPADQGLIEECERLLQFIAYCLSKGGVFITRALRIECLGAFYHVIHRGNAGAAIFRSERDGEKFMGNVAKAVERFQTKVHTHCLMTNHYHFLLETPEAYMSRVGHS